MTSMARASTRFGFLLLILAIMTGQAAAWSLQDIAADIAGPDYVRSQASSSSVVGSSAAPTVDSALQNTQVNSAFNYLCDTLHTGCGAAAVGNVRNALDSGQSASAAADIGKATLAKGEGSVATDALNKFNSAVAADPNYTPDTTATQPTTAAAGATSAAKDAQSYQQQASDYLGGQSGTTSATTGGSSGSTTGGSSGSGVTAAGSGSSGSQSGGNTPNSCGQGSQTRFEALAACLSDAKSCWACELYENVYVGMRSIVSQSYGYFVGGNAGAIALGTTLLAIALMVKVLPILTGTAGPAETGAKLKLFLMRIAIVFLVFLTTSTANLLSNPSTSDPGTGSDPGIGTGLVDTAGDANHSDITPTDGVNQTNPNIVSDWFVDGPLALGTAVATDLANVATTALSKSGGSSSATSPMADSSVTVTSQSNSLATAHIKAAKSMLLNIHKLGVAGIITGIWIATDGAGHQMGANIITVFAAVAVGIMITWLFFMFTLTFGLRYIDALIRSMMIFSLMPIFLYLWIFDSTREIATRALRSGLALAAVFAVSGVVFTVASYIMGLGFNKAFQLSGGGLDTNALQGALAQVKGGAFNFLSGSSGSATTLNWMSFCYLAGSASLAISCAKLAFDVASQLFQVGQTELGIGNAVAGEVERVAETGKGLAISAVGKPFGLR